MTVKKRILLLIVGLLGAFFVGVGQAAATGGSTYIVDDDGRASPPSNCGAITPAPPSIEQAVEAAPPGSTINVCPGTYTEQVSFESPDDNSTTIRSIVRRAAIIQAPPGMVANVVDEKAIVHVNGATNVQILAFTITGPGQTGCDSIHYGVWVENNGQATIDDNHITKIRDTLTPITNELSGCQNGVGVQIGRVFIDGPTVGTGTVTRNLIDEYQKNGMTIDNVGSRATVWGNQVIGFGPSMSIAQNGIQVSRGAYADVFNNYVADNTLVGPLTAVASSTGILLCGMASCNGFPSPSPGTTVSDNRVVRNDDNIGVYGTQAARILDNTVLDSTVYDGIYMNNDTLDNRIQGNFLRNNAEHDCHDNSAGAGTAGTANYWINNDGQTENRPGLCEGGHGDDDEDAEDDEDGEDDHHVHHNGHHGDGDDDGGHEHGDD